MLLTLPLEVLVEISTLLSLGKLKVLILTAKAF